MPARWFGMTDPTQNIEKKKQDLHVIQNLGEGDLNADTDGDGIKNWEEILRGTNPNIKDSPVVDTAVASSSLYTTLSKDDTLNDENNLTAQFSKNAYTLSTYLGGNNVTDDTLLNNLSQGLIDGEIQKLLIKRYSTIDIKTTNDESIKSVKNYGNILGSYIRNSFKTILSIDENTILDNYNKTKNTKDLEGIKTKIDSLDELQNNLRKMIVPTPLLNNHLTILNFANSYENVLKNIYSIENDPIRALAGYQALNTTFSYFLTSAYSFVDLFNKNNISFGANEGGYIFNSVK